MKIPSAQKPNLVKLDTHTHTAGISLCSNVSANLLARSYSAHGINTVLLTNHYTSRGIYSCGNYDALAANFCEEFVIAKRAGKLAGVCVLFGAEVALTSHYGYKEFLLFGITPAFLRAYPNLCALTQSELYTLCCDHQILMYQAHPYRAEHGQSPADPEFMDGVEINRHPRFDDRMDKVIEFADRHGLGISCGSDLHSITQAGSDGIFVPPSVTTEKALANYLRKTKRPSIFLDYKKKVQL